MKSVSKFLDFWEKLNKVLKNSIKVIVFLMTVATSVYSTDIVKYTNLKFLGREKVYVDLLKKDKVIQNHICMLMALSKSSRIQVFFIDDYEGGVSSENLINTSLHITHECKIHSANSSLPYFEKTATIHFSAFIKELEKGNGEFIVNDKIEIKNNQILKIYELDNAKSTAEFGIYRHKHKHRERYMIGVLVNTYMFDNHYFTKLEVENMKNVATIISMQAEMVIKDYEN